MISIRITKLEYPWKKSVFKKKGKEGKGEKDKA